MSERNVKQQRKAGETRKVRVSAEVKLDPKNPIPLELGNIPFYAVNGAAYIPFLDKSDNFLNTLLEARLQSVTQNACIVTKTNFSIGDGVQIKNLKEGEKPDPNWENFIKYTNTKRQNFNAVVRLILENLLTFGNVPIEIVRGTTNGKKFLYVYAKNALDCRLEWPDANGDVNNLIVSRYFRKKGILNLTEENCTKIPLYKAGPGSKAKYWYEDPKRRGIQRTAIWLKNDIAGYDNYGLPSYVPAIVYEMLEYNGASFNLDNLDNNMIVGGALVLAGNLSQDEASRLGKVIIDQHTGKGKRGRVAVFASEEGITNSKFESFDTHKDGSYIEMDDKAMQKIILANEWDATLAGLSSSNSLGKGNGYLNEVYQQKLKTVIKPIQRVIIDSFFGPLMEIADDWFGGQWSKYELDFQTTKLFNDTTEANTTVKGIEAFLDVIRLVASGAWELEAATNFVAARFGMTVTEAAAQLGKIKIVPTPQPTKTGTDVQS